MGSSEPHSKNSNTTDPLLWSDGPDESNTLTLRVKKEKQASESLSHRLDHWGKTPGLAARLIWEDMRYRQERGDQVSLDDYLERFPQWRQELQKLQYSSGWSAEVQFPKVGTAIAGYQLVAELGRGGQGQVFLARQTALAGRPVVLKFTACEGVEHLNLARLQHTSIVPLFAAEDIPERNLRLMCMPFLGGITLAEMLARLGNRPVGVRKGQEVERVLQEVQQFFAADLPGPGGADLGKMSYAAFVCRLGICLTEALEYAHQHGLVHLDIKPSNILLAPDGRPLLLDFHLARRPVRQGETKLAEFGGTWRFMSPEQSAAVLAASTGNAVPTAVDRRSDIYSLGLVLYETLGGERNAQEQAEPQRLCRANPQVSPGLADIVGRCLAEKPAHRYQDAGALAEDLRRHLEDRPLRGVANRSWRERWRKWRRRRPLALPIYGLVIALLATAVVAGMGVLSQQQDQRLGAERALWEGQELLRKQRFAEAENAFRQGQERVAGLPWSASLVRALTEHHRQAVYLHKAQELHDTVNALRFNTLVDPLPRRSLMVLELAGKNLWQGRDRFLQPPDFPLEAEVKERIQADLCDLALLRAEIHVRLAPAAQRKSANQGALAMLDEAAGVFGPHLAILLEQRRCAAALGLDELRDRLDGAIAAHSPQTAWDHVLLGQRHLHAGDWPQAEQQLRQAVRLRPVHYLSNFCTGVCAYRQGKHQEAAAALSFCLGRELRAEGFFFRGLCYAALGRAEDALTDFDQAIERDACLGLAYYERGRLRGKQERWHAALDDFKHALAHGADPTSTHLQMAHAHIALKDWPAAQSCLAQILQVRPDHEQALSLLRKFP